MQKKGAIVINLHDPDCLGEMIAAGGIALRKGAKEKLGTDALVESIIRAAVTAKFERAARLNSEARAGTKKEWRKRNPEYVRAYERERQRRK